MSLELPAPLAPWAPELAEWPLDLALALEPMLARLRLALGPAPRARATGGGEPDGFGGLARRGSYDRLVASEWLLADELPDEFDRRAAHGEHLFIRPARREPGDNAAQVALFDEGPAQLGPPRLAHLAALVVLAARAREAGAGFAWGIVQAPGDGLVGTLNPQSVRRLLEARTAVAASDAHALAWAAELPRGAAPRREVWLVGARGLAARPFGRLAGEVVVEDELEVGARRVLVTVTSGARTRGPVALELPDPEACARLLTAPFAVRPRDPAGALRVAPAPMHFAGVAAQRLIVRTRDGGVAALHIPDGAHRRPGGTFTWRCPPGHVPIAADVWRRRLVVVSRAPDGALVLWGAGGSDAAGHAFRRRLPPPPRPITPPDEHEPLSPVAVVPNQAGPLYWHDAEGRMLELDLAAAAPAVTVWRKRVIALGLDERGPLLVTSAFAGPEASLPDADLCRLAPTLQPLTHFPAQGLARAFLGCGRGGTPMGVSLALEVRPGVWRLVWGRTGAELHVPSGGEVVGTVSVRPRGDGWRPALLVLEGDRRQLSTLELVAGPRFGDADGAPITHACAALGQPRLALLREDGTVEVWRTDGTCLLRRGRTS